jgi:hypothetical protein
MKFIYADSLDFVDPAYDFLRDRSSPDRRIYWDDKFTHEVFPKAPYDGVLVSRAIVGDPLFLGGKYSTSQAMRFRRVGARVFLRLGPDKLLFGDCGAFSYHKEDIPPFKVDDTIEFYGDAGFTHGCSVDHVIFEFDDNASGMEGGSELSRVRYDITLQNAREFLTGATDLGPSFTPLGVAQGWSADSMAEAARQLVAMGYQYIALGGMVPLGAPAVHKCLTAIREVVGSNIQLHILGFAKANQIREFAGYNITSFDTTSPLLRAFKDQWNNYYSLGKDGALDYYTAIRVPLALENKDLKKLALDGVITVEGLRRLERDALDSLRAYDRGEAEIDETVKAVVSYSNLLFEGKAKSTAVRDRKIERLEKEYRRTLEAAPWRSCTCAICEGAGVEVAMFRQSNRNKRRGMHNLHVFRQHIDRLGVSGVE